MAVQLDEGHGIFLGPGEGEQLPGDDRELRILVSHEKIDALEIECGPGYGPDPHVHEREVDSFYMLEGELEFTIGEETVRAGPGSFVSAPPGVRHGFKNPGPGRARFLNLHTPADGFIDSIRSE
jgi:mannose-6-phosphate isomerase-like protein (cupin superfamily)